MIQGKTKTGFKYRISKKIIDDYELVELVTKIDEDLTVIPQLFEKLLGKKQLNHLKEHIRKQKGYVSMEQMSGEFFDIFAQNDQTKK